MSRGKTITISCQCGCVLVQYFKAGPGRLQKMYVDRIVEDTYGIFQKVALFEDVFCPECQKRIATIRRIHGKIAAKVNHGAIQDVRTT